MKITETRLLKGALIDRKTSLLLVSDVLSITAAFFLAYKFSTPLKELVWQQSSTPLAHFRDYVWLLMLIYPVYIFFLFYKDLYENHNSDDLSKTLNGVIYSSIFTLTILTLFMFLFKIQVISRFVILVFSFFNIMITMLSRLLLKHSWAFIRKLDGKAKRILVVGSRLRARDFLESIQEEANVELIGCVDTDQESLGKRVAGTAVISTLEDPRRLLVEVHPDIIVVAMPINKIPDADKFLDAVEEMGVPLMIMPDYHLTRHQQKLSLSTMSIENYYGFPMLRLATTVHPTQALFTKRVFDFFASVMLLTITLPLFAVISILIKLTSRGPVFYKWKVTGKNGREFTGYKFRTMVKNADRLKENFLKENEMNGPVFKMKKDPRITTVGKFLRKFSLDELPQLYSVFKGDMSLVGPRPPLRVEAQRFEFWQRRKLSVKPGITCLWQINGRNDISDFSDWVKLDLEYIDNWSLGLDFQILLKTIPAVIRGTGR